MKISELSFEQIATRLGDGELCLAIGPFTYRVSSPLAAVARAVHDLYWDYDLVDDPEFADFRIYLQPARGLRRFLKSSVRLIVDGDEWQCLPPQLAPAYLEWGLNWCIFRRAHHLLIAHAAVLEREGKAVVLPAESGSGKSTLAAALMHRGWRLLSDELTLLCPQTGLLFPAVKPICLKGAAIEALRRFAPTAHLGPVYSDPRNRELLAHVRPRRSSVEAAAETAEAGLVVFPRFQPGAGAQLVPRAPAAGFMKFAQGCFNYTLLGEAAFDAVGRLIDRCACHELVFGDLAAAVAAIDRISPASPAPAAVGAAS